jgi:hypothetical protein
MVSSTKSERDKPDKPDKKVSLTVSTLSGDYTDEFARKQKLSVVVERAIRKIPLEGPGPWILEHNGTELSQDQTIAEAGLRDGAILTLNPQEGGGGSGS